MKNPPTTRWWLCAILLVALVSCQSPKPHHTQLWTKYDDGVEMILAIKGPPIIAEFLPKIEFSIAAYRGYDKQEMSWILPEFYREEE